MLMSNGAEIVKNYYTQTHRRTLRLTDGPRPEDQISETHYCRIFTLRNHSNKAKLVDIFEGEQIMVICEFHLGPRSGHLFLWNDFRFRAVVSVMTPALIIYTE